MQKHLNGSNLLQHGIKKQVNEKIRLFKLKKLFLNVKDKFLKQKIKKLYKNMKNSLKKKMMNS